MAKILFEHLDGETEIPAKFVKLPLVLSQMIDDLLTSGAIHLIRSTVLGVFHQPLVDGHIVDVQFLDHTHPVADPHAD